MNYSKIGMPFQSFYLIFTSHVMKKSNITNRRRMVSVSIWGGGRGVHIRRGRG